MKKETLLAMAGRLNWAPIELEHAQDNVGTQYGEETVLRLTNGRELRTPSYPAECDYVRIVQEGQELAYWVSDEWHDSPNEVMGAILGCAHGTGCPTPREAVAVKTIAEKYGKAQAAAVAAGLIEEGRAFSVVPLPFDVYEVTVKAERPLPAPVGAGGLGFGAWLVELERTLAGQSLPADTSPADVRDYFCRGLTPSAVIEAAQMELDPA